MTMARQRLNGSEPLTIGDLSVPSIDVTSLDVRMTSSLKNV